MNDKLPQTMCLGELQIMQTTQEEGIGDTLMTITDGYTVMQQRKKKEIWDIYTIQLSPGCYCRNRIRRKKIKVVKESPKGNGRPTKIIKLLNQDETI